MNHYPTIRQELNEKLQLAKSDENGIALNASFMDDAARDMICEFIIPMLRQIFFKTRSSCLLISFYEVGYYTTNINVENKKISPYSIDVVKRAISIAEQYDIIGTEYKDFDNKGKNVYCFSLILID